MFERISIFIIAAMFTMLAMPGLWALTLSATADEHVEGGTTMSSQQTSRDTPRAGKADSGARASASATASASASASSSASASAKAGASSSADGSGKGGCRAESSSTAEARSGDEHVYDSDRDSRI
jgi:hypothetical protein